MPELKEIKTELEGELANYGPWVTRAEAAYRTRFTLWDGQSEDGRKHKEDLGKKPFPWDNASDARVRLADSLVNEQVRMLKAAFSGALVTALGVELNDQDGAHYATTLIRWLLQNQLDTRNSREVELLGQYRQSYGATVLGIGWEYRKGLRWQSLTIEQLTEMAKQNPVVRGILDAIMDPTQEDALTETVKQLAPGLKDAEARKVITDLRMDGKAEWPETFISESRPVWSTLKIGKDVFFPANTCELQRARWIARREWISEVELEARIESDGYDEAWVKLAKQQKGKSSTLRLDDMISEKFDGTTWSSADQVKDLIEVWTWYAREIERGAEVVRGTTFNPNVEGTAKEEDEDEAVYPFVEFVREWAEAAILDARGVPELVMTQQNEIKIQRDARSDRTSIATLPPVGVPASRGALQLDFGPAVQIPERRPGEINWKPLPPLDQGTIEIERATKADVDEYFGRFGPNVHLALSQLSGQDLAGTWLKQWKNAWKMTFKLAQRYMTPMEIARVTGQPPMKISQEDIAGRYDLYLEFDARELDTEFMMKKLELIGKYVLPLDVSGVTDRAELVRIAFRMVDPQLADRVVRDSAAVTQSEIEDEQSQFVKISAGVEPPLKEGGQNAQLRLQVLQNIVASNPEIQQRTKEDPIFAKLLETRVKHFQFMLQQQDNAKIGRIGVSPALGMAGQ